MRTHSSLARRLRQLASMVPIAPWREHRVLRWPLAASLPLLAGAVAQVLTMHLGVVHVSFVFMTSVICAGALFGAAPAVGAAVIAFALYNFFLVEPQFSLQLATADDFVTLLLFLLAAMLTGSVAGRLQEQAAISRRQLMTTQTLLEASRRLSREAASQPIFAALAESASHAFAAPALVLRASPPEWSVMAAWPQDLDLSGPDIGECALLAAQGDRSALWRLARLEAQDGRLIGALAVRRSEDAELREEEAEPTLHSLANLGAVAIERALLAAEMAEARALAETEQLRSALLSSMSHDFKTPLATIMASSTSLLDYEHQLGAEAKRELAQLIRDETENLSSFVANLLEMTKLEAGALRPRLVDIDVCDVAGDAAASVARRSAGAKIVQNDASIEARADPVLLERALVNLLENALAFSSPEEHVELITRTSEPSQVLIEVIDNGPGIAPEAQPFVFEKFWRAPEHAGRRRGVGLGLSIAKALVEAMGGTVALESPVRGGRGSRFVIALPAAAEQARP